VNHFFWRVLFFKDFGVNAPRREVMRGVFFFAVVLIKWRSRWSHTLHDLGNLARRDFLVALGGKKSFVKVN